MTGDLRPIDPRHDPLTTMKALIRDLETENARLEDLLVRNNVWLKQMRSTLRAAAPAAEVLP